MSALAEYGISPVYTGQESFRLTTGGRVVALPGQHARLFSLNVTTAASGAIVYIYDGVSTNGTLVAQVDASSLGSYVFGGSRCPNGIFANVLGGTIEATLGYEGSVKDGVLTLSGNEIRDTTRALNTQGDGVTAPDSSMGVWEGSTNIIPNGGFETDTSGWAARTACSIQRITTTSKFGSACLECNVSTSNATSTAAATKIDASRFPVTAGSVYSASAWLQSPNTTKPGEVVIEWWDGSAPLSESATSPTVALSSTFKYLKVIATAPVGAVTARVFTRLGGGVVNGDTWRTDGVMFELKPIPTPYVETNGASASRSAALATAPSSLINATQGWFALRIAMGFPSTADPYATLANVFLACWSDDGNNRFDLSYSPTSQKFQMTRRSTAGGITQVSSSAQVFAAGDLFTVIGYGTSTTLGVAVNGGAFATTSSTSIPVLTSSTFSIGRRSFSAEGWLDGTVYWFACGTGTLTNNDSIGINAMGSNDPQFSNFPAAAAATMIWHANTSQYLVP